MVAEDRQLADQWLSEERLENLFGTLSPEEQKSLQNEAEHQARQVFGNPTLPLPRILVRAELYILLEAKYGAPAPPSDS